MHVECPFCQRRLEYSGEPPRFCAYCGKGLGTDAPASGVVDLAYAPTQVPHQVVADEPTRDFHPSTAAMPVPEPDPERIGGYRLLRRLGGGGMGTVYEAEQESTGRRVALKLISKDYATSKDALARFRQEGRLASQISHPRCVFVLAVDEEAGRPYIVMELMPGHTLSDEVKRRGPLSVDEAMAKIADVIDGLRVAHQLGLVHRDVKPSNCFLQRDGRVKIGDFGLSKSLARRAEAETTGHGASLTRTGAFLGTPLYAAPEQVKGEKVDQQADVYAVCATLYFLLAGKAPFEGTGDALSVMARIVADDPRPLRELVPGIPAQLDQIVLKGLQRDRRQRWRDLSALRTALAPFLPQRFGYVGLGLRAGAVALDYLLLAIGFSLLQALLHFLHPTLVPENELEILLSVPTHLLLGILLPNVMTFLYFTLMESWLGATLAKWMLGLRVVDQATGRRGSWGRIAVRSGAFLAPFLVAQVVLLLLFPPPEGGLAALNGEEDLAPQAATFLFLVSVVFPIVSMGVGLAVICAPMRRSNGYRGFHELASGTRVIARRLGWLRPRARHRLAAVELPLEDSVADQRFGGFNVRGSYRLDDRSSILVAQESGLERPVWIWRRDAGTPPVPVPRQELSRESRWRWLSSGRDEGGQWDAFLAVPGQTLADAVLTQGPMSWTETRPLLEQLVDELLQAEADGTLPPDLDLGHLWLRTDGHLQLLDLSLLPRTKSTGGSCPDQQRRLLREFVCLCLEGQLREPTDVSPPRVALPLHVPGLLAGLFTDADTPLDLKALKQSLEETDNLPTEVSRGRRLVHLVGHAVAVSMGFAFVMLAAALLAFGFEITEVSATATATSPASTTAAASPAANATARRAGLRVTAGTNERKKDWEFEVGSDRRQRRLLLLGSTALYLFVMVGWSVATRGGLLFTLLGLGLSSVRGGPLSRKRCGLRTLLALLPILLFLVFNARAEFIGISSTNTTQQNVAAMLLVVYLLAMLGLAMWRPTASWYDHLAGSRVVPR